MITIRTYVVALILFACGNTYAQDYRGLWAGYLTTDPIDRPFLNVQYVLNVMEQTQNIVNGKAYVYRTNPLRAEGMLDFIGVAEEGRLRIIELKMIYSKIPADTNRFLCIKDLELRLNRENDIDKLTGSFRGTGESGTACYPGKAFLQRYRPENITNVPQSLLTRIMLESQNPVVFLKTQLARPIIIEVSENVLQLQVKDYLREDGDIVSIYHNRKPYLRRINITNNTQRHNLRLDKSKELHEIIMYAENLGEVPPNTSDLRIFDGEKEHRVLIQSSHQVSAVVYLRYKPVKKDPSE